MELELFRSQIDAYLDRHPEHLRDVERLRLLVSQKGMEAFVRSCFDGGESFPGGHVTGSLLVVSPDRKRVMLMRHKSLGMLLQFWGHCDGEVDTRSVALRECMEESGLSMEPQVIPDMLDIDVHSIPENPRKWEPAHSHYDVLFLWIADPATPFSADESETEWVDWYGIEEARNLVKPRLQRVFDKIAHA